MFLNVANDEACKKSEPAKKRPKENKKQGKPAAVEQFKRYKLGRT